MNQCNFIESGMKFQYDSDDVFLPEQSPTYKSLAKHNSIKSCDFIWYYRRKLLFIEVKTTAPNKDQDLMTYIQEIHLKLIHTLLMFLGIIYGRPFDDKTILPINLLPINMGNIAIVPVLIIQQHQKDWIVSLADKIRKNIKGTKKAYCMEDIIVLNEDSARKQGFIV